MTDIVERLRKIAGDDYHGQLEREAADEIDRLRAALREIAVVRTVGGDAAYMVDIARAALREPKP
jgi:hypothetical protein